MEDRPSGAIQKEYPVKPENSEERNGPNRSKELPVEETLGGEIQKEYPVKLEISDERRGYTFSKCFASKQRPILNRSIRKERTKRIW